MVEAAPESPLAADRLELNRAEVHQLAIAKFDGDRRPRFFWHIHARWEVLIGATLALWLTAGLGVTAGRYLRGRLEKKVMRWDDTNRRKVEHHDLDASEIEELFCLGRSARPSAFRSGADATRHWASPASASLLVIFEHDAATRWARVVTADETTKKAGGSNMPKRKATKQLARLEARDADAVDYGSID